MKNKSIEDTFETSDGFGHIIFQGSEGESFPGNVDEKEADRKELRESS